MASRKSKRGSRCIRKKRVRSGDKSVWRCAKFSVAGGRKAAKRKSTKRRRLKGVSARCAVKTISGRRRRICRDAAGRITSNRSASKKRRKAKKR